MSGAVVLLLGGIFFLVVWGIVFPFIERRWSIGQPKALASDPEALKAFRRMNRRIALAVGGILLATGLLALLGNH